jgi:hypothetical protein
MASANKLILAYGKLVASQLVTHLKDVGECICEVFREEHRGNVASLGKCENNGIYVIWSIGVE